MSGGGAQRTIVNIIKYINRDKFSPTLILLKQNKNDAYNSLIPKDVEIINLNRRGRYAFLKIKKLIDKNKPDILFSTLPEVNSSVWLGYKLSNRSPKLILRETNYREIGFNTSIIKQAIYKKIYNDADKVIGLSNGVTDHMIESYNLDKKKTYRVYNPIDIKHINKKKIEQVDINYRKDFKIIACGRLAKQKNYPMLINAIKDIKMCGNDSIELFILGDGPEKESLKKLIIENQLSDSIKLLGFSNNPYKYMKHADLFILSSSWEGFGHVIVEAMACGTPVLSTDCPHGPREILDNGKFGYLAKSNGEDLAYLIKQIVNSQQELNSMKAISLERAKEFDVNKIVKEYEAILSMNV